MNQSEATPSATSDCEYIVVGSGAGGGTVAARLAEEGCNVILLEAGGDPRHLVGGNPVHPDVNTLPADYDIPAFHALSSENSATKWDFFVRHYTNDEHQQLDPNYRPDSGGVLYPRAGNLGGCTAHNAMIFVYPQDEDWNYIARLTGDTSWEASKMRTYFQRMERCGHRPWYKWLARLGFNPSGHGWNGWLPTERALPLSLLFNEALARTVKDAAIQAFKEDGQQLRRIKWFLESGLDPNDARLIRDRATGIRYLPLTTDKHARTGTRERLLDVQRRFPKRLKIVLNALVTRILLDRNNRALGVEYLQGECLYRAHTKPVTASGERRSLFASHEVILAGGAFNTPQLLMLSGIGPREVLEEHGIEVRADLPGVGKNHQDRYEISVVTRMKFKAWNAYKGARFTPGDPQYCRWNRTRSGIYSTNGSVLTLFRRSPVAEEVPDLFCMSVLARFSGYFPSYSKVIAEKLNYLSWVILKAHTRNRSGVVTLRSNDPRDTPLINFNYFRDGGDEDLTAVVDGIRFVRRLTDKLKIDGMNEAEELPGDDLQTDEALKQYIRSNCWGHHASCTCPIGSVDDNGVLDSSFRVYKTRGLRVVDASVFPRIPGFFIACAIYMIGEKAADTILAERAHATPNVL
ncbi:MAG: choline dehydrogenase [Acidobacteriaceae bacterium]